MSAIRAPAKSDPEPSTGLPPDGERFFALSTDMLCVAGVDGYFKIVNQTWSQTLGYSDAELLATPYLDFVHPDDREATVAEASKLSLGFRTVHFRNRYRCKDGTYKWLAWTATPALANGLIYAGARDVTSTMRPREEADALRRQRRADVRSAIDGSCLRMVFQPIMAIPAQKVRGFEALARFDTEPVHTPDWWFREAGAAGARAELEIRAIRDALACFDRLPGGAFLSVNASPETLVTPLFAEVLGGLDQRRIVVEVTEHAAVSDYDTLRLAVARLREGGSRLAIDDAGAGFASMTHIIQLVPDFIKMDIFLIRDIDSAPVKRALASAMVSFASDIGATVVAEGVETAAELEALVTLNIDHAQGYLFGRPGALPVRD